MQNWLGLRANSSLPNLFAAALVFAVMMTTTGWSQTSKQNELPSIAAPSRGMPTLDGHQYKAGIVRATSAEEGEKKPLGDLLMFSGGKFSSAVCKRYNFAEAPYWIRIEGDQVHFLAELTSPTDGKMVWKGTIQGDTLEGTMRWTKKRWYWTVDTEHKISGKLDVVPSVTPPATN